MKKEVSVTIPLNPADVLDELSTDEIVEYLRNRYDYDPIQEKEIKIVKEITPFDYFHGDFNLLAFLKKLGKDETLKIIEKCKEDI